MQERDKAGSLKTKVIFDVFVMLHGYKLLQTGRVEEAEGDAMAKRMKRFTEDDSSSSNTTR